jgi:hypothetical protein
MAWIQAAVETDALISLRSAEQAAVFSLEHVVVV